MILRFLLLLRPELKAVSAGIAISLLASLSSVSLMATAGWFLTAMGVAGFYGTAVNIFFASALIRMLALSRTLLRYLERLISHRATFKIITVLRLELFEKALRLDLNRAQRLHSSDTERVLRCGSEKLEQAFLKEFVPFVCAFLCGAAAGACILSYSALLGLVTLGLALLSGVLIPFLCSLACRREIIAAEQSAGELLRSATDLCLGLADLMLTGSLPRTQRRLLKISREHALSRRRQDCCEGFNAAFALLCANLTLLLIIYCGAPLLQRGTLDGPELIMLALGAAALYEVILPLAAAANNLYACKKAARAVFTLFDAEPERSGTQSLGERRLQSIELEHVSFTYAASCEPVLQDVSLNFRPEENYLIRGRSGLGKSSLAQLLLGLIRPQQGSIRVNGEDLRLFTPSSLRSRLACAPQDNALFSGTLREIFTAVRPDATDAQILELLELVELDDFVCTLPQGFGQWLGSTGTGLSGGQERRLCLARALLRDGDFLILDEPGEGLDSAQEQRILKRILRRRSGVIIISHRDEEAWFRGKIIDFTGHGRVSCRQADAAAG